MEVQQIAKQDPVKIAQRTDEVFGSASQESLGGADSLSHEPAVRRRGEPAWRSGAKGIHPSTRKYLSSLGLPAFHGSGGGGRSVSCGSLSSESEASSEGSDSIFHEPPVRRASQAVAAHRPRPFRWRRTPHGVRPARCVQGYARARLSCAQAGRLVQGEAGARRRWTRKTVSGWRLSRG